ncbi:MAG: hypothetical protein IPK26_20500 [Planctomycetes bacterium]|nr:hypothetical protein [Planctomycetota bacterium]
MTTLQILGNACAALALIVFLWPLQRVLSQYAPLHSSDDRWARPALYSLVPLWALLLVALACMVANGGFDWLGLGRPALYPLSIGAAIGLAVATFVGVGLYIRPGMLPRAAFFPFVCLAPVATLLLLVFGLNPGLAGDAAPRWLRLPWVVFAALSLLGSAFFFGRRAMKAGLRGVAITVARFLPDGPSSKQALDEIASKDPQRDFESLLWRAGSNARHDAHAAATARLRSHPDFLDRLASELETGHVEPAVDFVCAAQLSAEERARLAQPARRAMAGWVDRIPAPNYTTRQHLAKLRRIGVKLFHGLEAQFAGTGVDFSALRKEFESKVSP